MFENPKIITVEDAARELGVSTTWLYRHQRELPSIRVGKLLRFDSVLLLRHFQSKYPARTESRLKPKGGAMGFSRYQRGTVYKCGKRIKVWYGRWREDVRLPDGGFSRCQRNERLGTMMELPTRSSAYEELSRRMSRVVSAADGLKFSALVERWKAAVLPTIKETTAKQYESELRSQLVPVFGERIVSSIGRYDVEMFLADKAKSYCRNTLRGMRVSLSVVLSWAVACGWLDKNPCAGVRLPNAGKRIVRTILQLEDVLAIADKLQEPYATLVLFLAVTGLRVGEAIAVKWEDFDGDVLQISRRIYQGKIDTPKSEKSKRSLPIPKELLARIKSLG